ncbi:MAG: PEP-CTERM sorting domain-containing protein [Bryobacteraceae bacterium]
MSDARPEVRRSGSPVDLGTLGGAQSYAYGIDSSGDIVGYSYLAGDTAEHAFLFTNGVMIDLNNLLPFGSDWTIDYAYAIDDAGEIAAMGIQNGEQYAVELIPAVTSLSDPEPVPEPATLMLSGLGLLVLFKIFAAKRKPRRINETRPD